MMTIIVTNAYGIKVRRTCASCKHRVCQNNGTRNCVKMDIEVGQKTCCNHWEMSDGLKRAGMQMGGVVRLKGTQIVLIN